jgi:hypothetical protein
VTARIININNNVLHLSHLQLHSSVYLPFWMDGRMDGREDVSWSRKGKERKKERKKERMEGVDVEMR